MSVGTFFSHSISKVWELINSILVPGFGTLTFGAVLLGILAVTFSIAIFRGFIDITSSAYRSSKRDKRYKRKEDGVL